jgi:hypothetical protein
LITDDLLPMLDDPTFSDEDLAKLADVPVAEVAAIRAKRTAAATVETPAKPARAPRTKPAEPVPAPAPETAEVEAPATVRVTVGEAFVSTGALNKRGQPKPPVRIARRDVYSGEFAALLWEKHRHLVEPYGA